MRKDLENQNTDTLEALRIPAKIIGYVHDTTDNAVRVAKSVGKPISKVYESTEREIVEAVERIKLSKKESNQ